jgi:hypothetical protein
LLTDFSSRLSAYQLTTAAGKRKAQTLRQTSHWLMAPCQYQGSSSMSKKIKALYLFVSSLVIGIFHLSFAFAKSATGNKLFYHPPASNCSSGD